MPPPLRSGGAARVNRWLRALLVAWVAWLLLRTFVVQAFHVTSESMEGTLLAGDVLCVARPLTGARVPLTGLRRLGVGKRVIGLPGDTIGMRAGRVVRNGRPLIEPYTVHARPSALGIPGPDAGLAGAEAGGNPPHALSSRPRQLAAAAPADRDLTKPALHAATPGRRRSGSTKGLAVPRRRPA